MLTRKVTIGLKTKNVSRREEDDAPWKMELGKQKWNTTPLPPTPHFLILPFCSHWKTLTSSHSSVLLKRNNKCQLESENETKGRTEKRTHRNTGSRASSRASQKRGGVSLHRRDDFVGGGCVRGAVQIGVCSGDIGLHIPHSKTLALFLDLLHVWLHQLCYAL